MGSICVGAFGGVAGELVVWFNARNDFRKIAGKIRHKPVYFLVTAAMCAVGGALVVVYLRSGIALTPVLSVHIGVSATLILQGFGRAVPPITPGKSS